MTSKAVSRYICDKQHQPLVVDDVPKTVNGKFNFSDASTLVIPDFLRAQNMVRVTEGKITVKCMTEIHGKSILLQVCAKFELARVRVIGSQL